MRTFKFRAWLVETDYETEKEKPGKMIYFDAMTYCDEYNHLGFSLAKESRNPDGGGYSNLCVGINDFKEVMEFTGLRDKNGLEIYDGDIVKNGLGRTYTIESCVGGFQCVDDGFVHAFSVLNKDCEVIGNKWEGQKVARTEGIGS